MTDSIEFSRRGMIAVASAGLALAGCNATKSPNKPVKIAGIDPPYGDEPNPTSTTPQDDLSPLALTLVRIASTGNFGLDINYASVKNTSGAAFSNIETDREAIARKWFKKLENGSSRRRFRGIPDETVEVLHRFKAGTTSASRDLDNFNEFGSNGKSEYYFWIDSPQIEFFRRRPLNTGEPDRYHLISFSRILTNDDDAKPNKTFLARPVLNTGLQGLVIAVKNYFRDEYGNDMQKDDAALKYAMNIHFKAKANGNLLIPMVIDPDTGNGVGYEP